MKTSKSIFLMALIIIFFEGCNKDDPAPVSLIGTWILISEVASDCIDPADNFTDSCSGAYCEEWIFSETSISVGIYSSSYTKSGNKLLVTVSPGVINEGIYSISGSTLTLTYQDSPADGGCKNVSTFTKKG